jgi:hypothetical protein
MRVLLLLCLPAISTAATAQKTWEYESENSVFVMQKYFMSLLLRGTEKRKNDEGAIKYQEQNTLMNRGILNYRLILWWAVKGYKLP